MKNLKLISPCITLLFLWNVLYYDAIVCSKIRSSNRIRNREVHSRKPERLLAKITNREHWPPFSIFGNAQTLKSIAKYLYHKDERNYERFHGQYTPHKHGHENIVALKIGADAVKILKNHFNVKIKSVKDLKKVLRAIEAKKRKKLCGPFSNNYRCRIVPKKQARAGISGAFGMGGGIGIGGSGGMSNPFDIIRNLFDHSNHGHGQAPAPAPLPIPQLPQLPPLPPLPHFPAFQPPISGPSFQPSGQPISFPSSYPNIHPGSHYVHPTG